MNKASTVKLSLRRLFTAMLALGPVAVLPSPLWAAIPSPSAITVTNGTASIIAGANTLNVNASTDRTVLVWANGAFNSASGETYTFTVPNSGTGAILNKVGYNTDGSLATPDVATIGGQLFSNGRVFVLANGNIIVGGTAVINTQGGLVLSTLQEAANNNFTGNLALNGTATGNISIGDTAAPQITGGLEAWGNTILVNAVQVNSGNTILRSVTSGSDVILGNRGSATFLGNLTVGTNGGEILGNTAGGAANGGVTANVAVLSTNSAAQISLGNLTNDFSTVTISNSAGSNVTLGDTSSITVAASTLGNLTITANGAISTSGNVAASGNVTLASTLAGDITFGNNSAVGGTFNATATSGNISVATVGNLTVGTLTGTSGLTSITVNPTGALNLGDINLTSGGSANLTATTINSTSTSDVNLGATGVANYTATNGAIVLGNITGGRFNVTTNNGALSQAANTILDTNAGTYNLTTGTGNITLNNASNSLGNSTFNLVAGTVSLISNSAVTIASANTTGNLLINTTATAVGEGPVVIGQGGGTSAPSISIGGGLSITTNASTISDDPDLTLRVFGAVNLNTVAGSTTATTGGAAVTLTSAQTRGTASLGQISVYTGNASATIAETQTINIGSAVMANILENNTGGALTLNSTGGSIIFAGGNVSPGSISANANTGNITQTGSINLLGNATSSFRASSAGNIILENSGNNFGQSTVSVTNNAATSIVAGSTFSFTGPGMNGTNATVNLRTTSGDIRLTGGNVSNLNVNSAGRVVIAGNMDNYRNLTITAADSSSTSISQTARLQSNGTVTLNTAGNVALTNAANLFSNVVLGNVAGDSAITAQRNMTVSGTSLGNLTAVAGAGGFENPWVLTFGNLNVKNLTANVQNGASNAAFGGNSGDIVQAAGTNLHVENESTFISYGGNIVLGNEGNSFGRINAFTGGAVGTQGNSSITVVEEGGLRIGNIATLGSANLTSRFNSVFEDNNADVVVSVNGTNSVLSLNAPNGSVLLGNTSHTLGNTTANITGISIVASGAAAITSSGNLTLGAMSVNTLTASSGNNIAQSGPLSVYGPSSFTAAGNIILTDSSNNFGPLSFNSTGVNSNISVTEGGTLNLRTVTMVGGGNGTFTANSVNGDIVDTGFGGVRPGGTIGATGTGVVSLLAANGNITIDDLTSDFPTVNGVVFNAKNVNLTVLGNSTLVLGNSTTTSVATGNLTAKTALGAIENMGALHVGGMAAFEAASGNVTATHANNRFDTLRFIGNEVRISQANDMNIATGSTALGIAELASTGSYVTIANVGGEKVTFGNTVMISAASSITLPDLVQAVGTLTVNAPGTKDLSALSVSGDLGNKEPVNQGTGSFVAPQP